MTPLSLSASRSIFDHATAGTFAVHLDPYNGSRVFHRNALIIDNQFWGNVGGDLANAAFTDSAIINNVITSVG